LPVGYLLGAISIEALNRIGIVLNFAAGFMLAPELLGRQRLATMEDRIELFTKNAVQQSVSGHNAYVQGAGRISS
ncbi:MAG: hypothetical protein HC828_16700, partial [Blastochloris sp.]|nr:hypothetical protein [Blastochloris sp.]